MAVSLLSGSSDLLFVFLGWFTWGWDCTVVVVPVRGWWVVYAGIGGGI